MAQKSPAILGERGGTIGLALAYAALFVSIGVYMPFFPVFLADRGFSPEAIGLTAAIPVVLRFITLPAAGALSDRIASPRAFMVVLGLLAALGFAGVGLSGGPVALCLALAFAVLFWNPAFPLLESYALRLASRGVIDYGRMRLWGSLSFIAANLGAGVLLGVWSSESVAWMIAAAFAAFGLCAAVMPAIPGQAPHHDEGGSLKPSRFLVLGVVAAAFIQASHALLYAFASIHWERAGLSSVTIGSLWATGVLAEIVLFIFATRLARVFSPMALIGIGGAAAVLRFGVLAADPPAEWLFPLQLLHGLTFGATHLGLMALIAGHTPQRAAGRAQAYSSTVVATLMGLATVASGPLYAAYAAASYTSSMALGAIGALLALYVWSQPQRLASGGKRRAPS